MFIIYTPLSRYFITISPDMENKESRPQKSKGLKRALSAGFFIIFHIVFVKWQDGSLCCFQKDSADTLKLVLHKL